jgi:1-acyl-sn-glycerol-3-phosphate acyltransferase
MIAIIQIIFTTIVTLIYALEVVDFSNWLLILSLIGFYIGINILFTVLTITLFFVIVLLTKKVDQKAIWKHNLYMVFANYYFYSVLRVKLIIKGKENLPKDQNFVVYSNHIEYNDPLIIKSVYKNTALAFIAKKPLFDYPLIRDVLESSGCIPIGPLADRSSLESILQAIKQVKDGQAMAMFPEGKRSYSNEMNPFKPGAFKVASKAKADISLVTLYDFHKMNVHPIRIKKVKVYLSILPLIKYEDYKDMDTVKISQMAFKKINAELNDYKNIKS